MNEKAAEYGEDFAKFTLKKRRFLEHYAETGSISQASLHAGVSRVTHLNWRKKDRKFFAACEEALSIAIDLMETEARRRAVEAPSSRSTTAAGRSAPSDVTATRC